ncbi:MAG: OB-fold nucleic acid binding domain-containing protein [Allobranchiibius sp.]
MGAASSIREAARRFTRSSAAIEQDELRVASSKNGGTPIDACCDRQVVQCCGTVRYTSLRPRTDSVPAFVVGLDDGTRTMQLVWLGRRSIAGIEPGVYLSAKGRVLHRRGMPTIFNPDYEIKPSSSLD